MRLRPARGWRLGRVLIGKTREEGWMPNSRRARHEHGQGGFTLVELLIGFIIIFGVPAMAIPAYLSITRNLRSNGDARDINGEVALAKMRAAADFTQARFYADLA